eukprot:1376195-Amphidinium_carterae.1
MDKKSNLFKDPLTSQQQKTKRAIDQSMSQAKFPEKTVASCGNGAIAKYCGFCRHESLGYEVLIGVAFGGSSKAKSDKMFEFLGGSSVLVVQTDVR